MPTMEIGPGNSIAFVTATGDELLRQEWNDTEQRVDIIDPDTGNPIGHYDADGNLTMTGEVTIPNAALGSLTQNLDADGNDLTNVGALGAEQATINNRRSDDSWELVQTETSISTDNSNPTSIVFNGLGQKIAKLRFVYEAGNSASIFARVDGDSGQNYTYIEKTGASLSKVSDDTEFRLKTGGGGNAGNVAEFVIASEDSRLGIAKSYLADPNIIFSNESHLVEGGHDDVSALSSFDLWADTAPATSPRIEAFVRDPTEGDV